MVEQGKLSTFTSQKRHPNRMTKVVKRKVCYNCIKYGYHCYFSVTTINLSTSPHTIETIADGFVREKTDNSTFDVINSKFEGHKWHFEVCNCGFGARKSGEIGRFCEKCQGFLNFL